MAAVTYDSVLGTEVLTLPYQGEAFRAPRLLGGRYEVQRVLAAGGFGVLFLARDQRVFGRPVVVKTARYAPTHFNQQRDRALVDAVVEARQRAEEERRNFMIGLERDVPGIPVLIDALQGPGPHLRGPHVDRHGEEFWLDEGGWLGTGEPWRSECYLVISRVSGQTLDQACLGGSYRDKPLGATKHVLRQLGGILAAFHAFEEHNGADVAFIYQDLKPENVLYTDERNVVLIDLGSLVARTRDQVFADRAVSTAPYAPPEFGDGRPLEETLIPAWDVYTLGATAVHLLGGEKPQTEADLKPDAWAKLQLPAAWDAFLTRCLAPRAEDRYEVMSQFLAAVSSLPVDGRA